MMAKDEPPAGDGEPTAEINRKERRKLTKKEKRKQKRREIAEKVKEEEEAKLNDPEEQMRIEMEEVRERERAERERKEFEEKERLFLEAVAEKKRREEAEAEEIRRNQVAHEDENESDWEYVEDGPPEIIWRGNEIIVKKKKIKVKRKDGDQLLKIEDHSRPTSNPFPPESETFIDPKNEAVVSAQHILDNAAQQNPNFGTEQDKAHCPFQIKTGACRFGLRCSRLHFYPDKSCTLLIKNMYNGPGLAFEQDEGLEIRHLVRNNHHWGFSFWALAGQKIRDVTEYHTDEEVDRCFEEFYEDVHTEFLKFGEIVNFKVCRNSSLHLRGNLYVHYKSLDSALLAYQSINGRYFAGKQITCEFVGVTKWRVAICGEFMRSRLKTCSRGTACNFIHCFRNPGGDYEWADWDKPPPRYWVQEMAALFGHSPVSVYDNQRCSDVRKSSETTTDMNYRRSRSRERRSSRDHGHEEYDSRSGHSKRYQSPNRKSIEYHRSKNRVQHDSDREQSNDERDEDSHRYKSRISNLHSDNQDYHKPRADRNDSDAYSSHVDRDRDRRRNKDERRMREKDEDVQRRHKRRSSTPRRKSREKLDNNADEDILYKMKRRSSTPKRKSWDKWDSSDEDMHHENRGKSSTHKRKSRDSNPDSEIEITDKGKSHKHSRKSSKHSIEDLERRGRWDDDTVGVEIEGTS